MISIKSHDEIQAMFKAGQIVARTLKLLGDMAVPGTSTLDMDNVAMRFIRDSGATPSFLNYNGFPNSICVSVNHEVVHGIPNGYRLKSGDIVSCDVGACLNGWHGDAARTFLVGDVDPDIEKLVRVTRECFYEGLKYARVGYRISDISKAIQKHAESHGYGVVRELIGHGIGVKLHESPDVPNFYDPRHGKGPRLQPGMTIAVEPMINMGLKDVWQDKNGWTIVTRDGLPSAHYENTIAITDDDPIITTLLEDQA